jgi:ubiquinone/menaquinone biosynthesis C-methylase UbiE
MTTYDSHSGRGRLQYGAWWDQDFYEHAVVLPLEAEIGRLIQRKGGTTICIPGIGTGAGVDNWIERGGSIMVVGFDLSLNSLRIARKLYQDERRIEVIQADGDHLPFRQGVFDVVFCKSILHHMTNPSETLSDLRKLTRNGGCLIAIEPGLFNPLLAFARRFLPSNLHTPGERPFIYSRLFEMLKQTGWNVTSTSYFVFINTFLLAASKVLKSRVMNIGMATSVLDRKLCRGGLREMYWFVCLAAQAD